MNPFEAWVSGFNQIQSWFGNSESGNFFLDIINGLLSGIFSIIQQFFSMLGLNLSIPVTIFDPLNDITRGIGYILPLDRLTPLVFFALAFYVGRIIMAAFNRVYHTTIRRIKVIK